MKSKRVLFFTILLLTIGFASVATNLIINSTSLFATNEGDFDVYFSKALLDENDISLDVISEDKKSITYKGNDLTFLGEKSVLEYEVTNASKNYDANVKIECISSNEIVSIIPEPKEQIIKSTEIESGLINVELNKTVVEEQVIEFTCTLNIEALERENMGENDVPRSDSYALIGNYVDESGNAIANANLVIYSETPHYVTTDAGGNIYYDGLEYGEHEIYYVNDTIENIKLMSKEEVINNSQTSARFKTDTEGDLVFKDSTRITNNKIVNSLKYCEGLVGRSFDYGYTGSEQEFIPICNGIYKLETWGAQGGSSTISGGKGGYSYGNLEITEEDTYYIYVGQNGFIYDSKVQGDRESSAYCSSRAYNGGGLVCLTKRNGTTGGGATDIRTINGAWNNSTSLASRIMVAGGGGGAGHSDSKAAAGVGGGGAVSSTANGTSNTYGTKYPYSAGGASLTSGGKIGTLYTTVNGKKNTNGSLGIGGNGVSWGNAGAGGGGGYYGGAGGYISSGGGGSGYINTALFEENSYGGSRGVREGHGYARFTLVSLNNVEID